MRHPASSLRSNLRNSMIFRIFYINLSVALIFSVGGAMLTLSRSASMMYEKERSGCLEVVDSFYDFVFQRYYSVFNISNRVYSSTGISNTLHSISRNPNYGLSYEASSAIYAFSEACSMSDEDIWDIIVVSGNRHAYHYSSYAPEHSVLQSFSYLDYAPLTAFWQSDEKSCVFYDEMPDYTTRNSAPVITFANKIYHFTNVSRNAPIGLILVNYKYDAFAGCASQLARRFNGTLLIYDSDQTILFSTNPKEIGASAGDILDPLDKSTLLVSQKVGLSGLSVAGFIAEGDMFYEVNSLRRSQVLILLACVLVSLLTMTVIFRHYYRRVRVLVDIILKSDLSERAPVESKDELGLISAAYNEMCNQIQTWIDRQYRTQLSLHAAQLYRLTAQINPHFIYNTLEGIRMQAVIDGNKKVSEMLVLFANMFRWAIHQDESIVAMDEELSYIASYLRLQNIRMADAIDVKIDIPDAVLDYGIPKLILQPIVENALMHGRFDEVLRNGRQPLLTIRAAAEGDRLIILVEDNGYGIPEDKLRALQESLCTPATEVCSDSIGCKNVHDRLRLMFGPDFGIEISSREGCGTAVRLNLPLMTREEMRKYV